jgi:carbonic anhydrase
MTLVPQSLLAGYRRFRKERFANEAARYRRLALEQHPRVMIIGCADSRVDPSTIFSADPGELFVVRNVAAIVPPLEENGTFHGTSAAVEFAVTGIGVTDIVVMGHGMCGGIQASLAAAHNRPVGRFIRPWVNILSDARDDLLARSPDASPAQLQKALEHIGVQQSLANLRQFPFVQKALAEQRLSLHGAWFSIGDGELHWLDMATGTFQSIDP